MKKTNNDAMADITSEPTDIVVDNYVLQSLARIPFHEKEKDTASVISDVARLIEAFVFHSRVIVFPYPARNSDEVVYFATQQLYAYGSLLNLAQSENAFCYASPGGGLDEVPHPVAIVKQVANLGLKLDVNIADVEWGSHLESAYMIYQQELARQAKVPFVPSERSNILESYMSKSHKARINLCRNIISTLDSATKKDVEMLQNTGVPIQYYIPPLLSLVLEKVDKGAEFGEAVWELREKFGRARILIAEYEMLLQDTSKPLKDTLRMRSKIFNDIELLSKTFEKRDQTKLKEWADILDTIPDLLKDVGMGNLPKASLIATLIKLPMEQLRSLALKRRYSLLFKTKRDFYNIRDYATLLERTMRPFQEKWQKEFGLAGSILTLSTEPEPKRRKKQKNN